jgi:hypothetical protein
LSRLDPRGDQEPGLFSVGEKVRSVLTALLQVKQRPVLFGKALSHQTLMGEGGEADNECPAGVEKLSAEIECELSDLILRAIQEIPNERRLVGLQKMLLVYLLNDPRVILFLAYVVPENDRVNETESRLQHVLDSFELFMDASLQRALPDLDLIHWFGQILKRLEHPDFDALGPADASNSTPMPPGNFGLVMRSKNCLVG